MVRTIIQLTEDQARELQYKAKEQRNVRVRAGAPGRRHGSAVAGHGCRGAQAGTGCYRVCRFRLRGSR